jgi:hypothetical protein
MSDFAAAAPLMYLAHARFGAGALWLSAGGAEWGLETL